MSVSATLDEASEESGEILLPRGKTLVWSVDETDLANGEVRLLVSKNDRGSYAVATSTAVDASGRVVNDTAGNVFAKFVLVETAESISGAADVTLDVEAAVVVVLRDPVTNKILAEYGDSLTTFRVPIAVPQGIDLSAVALLDLSAIPDYADNAAALSGGAAVGSVYAVTTTGALARVLAA